MHKRRNFPLSVIKQRLAHCGWQCEGRFEDGTRCKTIVTKGRFRCNHVIPDFLGGEPVFENAEILCLLCDKQVTSKDLSIIAKVKRVEAADWRAKPRPQRPLPCGRHSPFKKKIDGTVVLRKQESARV